MIYGGTSPSDTIRAVTERQDKCFATLAINFTSLWGRPLQLIDCQNLFCEVGKYAELEHTRVCGYYKASAHRAASMNPSLRICLLLVSAKMESEPIDWEEFRVFRVFEAPTADDVWQQIAENFRQGRFNQRPSP